MAVPRRRTSKSRTRMRRAHDALARPTLIRCPRCKRPMEPHTVCANCGHYRGEGIIQVEEI